MKVTHFLREDYDPDELRSLPRLERYWLFRLVHAWQCGGNRYDSLDHLNLSREEFEQHPEFLAVKHLERLGYVRVVQDESMVLTGMAGLELDSKGMTLGQYGYDLLEIFQ